MEATEYVEVVLESAWGDSEGFAGFDVTDWPKFNLNNELKKIKGIKVVEALIPNTYFNVMDPRGYFQDESQQFTMEFQIVIGEFGVTFNEGLVRFTPPEGNYTPQSYAAKITSFLNSSEAQAEFLFGLDDGSGSTIYDQFTSFEFRFDENLRKFYFFFGCPADNGSIFKIFQPNNDLYPYSFLYRKFIGWSGFGTGGFHLTPTYDQWKGGYVCYMEEPVRPHAVSHLTLCSNILGGVVKNLCSNTDETRVNNETGYLADGYFSVYSENLFRPFDVPKGLQSYNLSSMIIDHEDKFKSTHKWVNDDARFYELPLLANLNQLDLFFTRGNTAEIMKFRGASFTVKLGLLIET